MLDAGTGSGILAFLAHKQGAAEVIGVDRLFLHLARDLAEENGLSDEVTFIEHDLYDTEIPGVSGKFDTLLAFMYMNHIILDAERSKLILSLKERYLKKGGQITPNKVRYKATLCYLPERDLATQTEDMRRSQDVLECTYDLTFKSLIESSIRQIPPNTARPNYNGHYAWWPGNGMAAARFDRSGGMRLLSETSDFYLVDYNDPETVHGCYPETLALNVISDGPANGVIWSQELLHDDIAIWTTESFSPLSRGHSVKAGDRLEIDTGQRWFDTHILNIISS